MGTLTFERGESELLDRFDLRPGDIFASFVFLFF
jgi:hypothetical protein